MRHAFAVAVEGHRFIWRWQLGDEDAVLDALCQQFRFVPNDHPLWIAGMKLAAYLHQLKQVQYFED